jgi:hypothetical protein
MESAAVKKTAKAFFLSPFAVSLGWRNAFFSFFFPKGMLDPYLQQNYFHAVQFNEAALILMVVRKGCLISHYTS